MRPPGPPQPMLQQSEAERLFERRQNVKTNPHKSRDNLNKLDPEAKVGDIRRNVKEHVDGLLREQVPNNPNPASAKKINSKSKAPKKGSELPGMEKIVDTLAAHKTKLDENQKSSIPHPSKSNKPSR
jgi:hypothetical protein